MTILIVTALFSCVLQTKLVMDEFNNKNLKKWASGIRKSDKESFDQLFRVLYPRLKHFARSYTRDGATASDIVQDAFVSLWQNRIHIEPEKSITSYLYMAVRNKALNYIRDYDNRMSHFGTNCPKIEAPTGDLQSGYKVDDSANELASHFKKWISELPARQKEAFTLSRFEGFDHEEIGEIMDISSNTVNNHIMAALNYLRNQYQQHKNSNPNYG